MVTVRVEQPRDPLNAFDTDERLLELVCLGDWSETLEMAEKEVGIGPRPGSNADRARWQAPALAPVGPGTPDKRDNNGSETEPDWDEKYWHKCSHRRDRKELDGGDPKHPTAVSRMTPGNVPVPKYIEHFVRGDKNPGESTKRPSHCSNKPSHGRDGTWDQRWWDLTGSSPSACTRAAHSAEPAVCAIYLMCRLGLPRHA